MGTMQFTRATKKKSKLRLGLAGPSNAGKTLGALMIAKALGGTIALIDTERGSASLYSSSFEFDVLELNPPYSPERFIEAIHAAENAGYANIIIDSLTHEWDGAGGCLEINEQVAQAKYRGNTWSAWSDTTPRHQAMIDALLQSPSHTIATMRSKTETVQTDDKKVKKIGMKVEQRKGSEYEFGLMLEIDHDTHLAVLTKGRLYDAPKDVQDYFEKPHKIDAQDGAMLLKWLDSGAEMQSATPVNTGGVVADIVATDIKPTQQQLDRWADKATEFRGALNADKEEHEIAELISGLAASLSQEDQLGVWTMLDSKERRAIKDYKKMGTALRAHRSAQVLTV